MLLIVSFPSVLIHSGRGALDNKVSYAVAIQEEGDIPIITQSVVAESK